MHIFVSPTELVNREPWLPEATIDMWQEAKEKTLSYYSDPGYSLLLFGRNALEAERAALQADPWISGLAANRANLEQFIRYLADQNLIEEAMPVESLFHESVLNT